MVYFQDTFNDLDNNFFLFMTCLNMMHAWRAVDLRIHLAKKNHGYSILAPSYNFCPHLIKLDILDFTLSHIMMKLHLWKNLVKIFSGVKFHIATTSY